MIKSVLSLGLATLLCGTAAAQQEVVPPPAAMPAVTYATYHSGWAGLSDGKLSGQVVTLTDDGGVASEGEALVELLSNNMIVATTQADANGDFTFNDIAPGIYGVRAEGSNSFGAYSFRAVPVGADIDGSMKIYSAKMARPSVTKVFEDLWAPSSNVSNIPAFQGVAVEPMNHVQTPVVKMQNGVVYGQVAFENSFVIPQSHVVKVYRGSELVTSTTVDSMARFSFSPGAPGVYTVVVGGNAYGCYSVYVVDAAGSKLTATSGNSKLVNVTNNLVQADTLLIPAIGPTAPITEERPLGPELTQAGTPMGGGFGGGAGGGGAGGGGAGGIGGLLGAAGLAAGITALANDDDGFDFNQASPIQQ